MKNILICVSGLTPQIITETFYCLAIQKNISISHIYVITTSRGRDIIYGCDKQYNLYKKYPPLKNELTALCKKYNIKIPKFENNDTHVIVARELTAELQDIRDDSHNRLFPNKVCEVIRKFTSINENVLHCSVSGGRKTMSVDLAFALSLFGREKDKLYHVITDEKFEFKGFYPVTKAENNALTIAEIPYVRLRPLMESASAKKFFKSMTYTDIVASTQKELLKKTIDKLYIDKRKNNIRFSAGDWVHVPQNLLETYLAIYDAKKKGSESIDIKDLSLACLGKTHYTKNILTRINKLNKLIDKAIEDHDIRSLFIILGPREKAYEKGHYGFYALTNNFEIID
jgi:CRISPR-associated protein (TIGR02584 family)